jgi:hypothetical protein
MQIENTPFKNMVWFMGVVESIADPQGVGRVQARAIGFHTEDRSSLSTNTLPWATFLVAGADTSAPMVKPGDWVVGFFLDNTEAQQPVILGKLHGFTPANTNSSVGFSDPTGTFPRLANTATTSELARGVSNTVVQYKTSTVANGVTAADGSTWSEPATKFAAVYPENYVIQTDQYNIIELDDTSGAARVHVFHHNGSFHEFHPNGDVVQRTLGGHYMLGYNGWNIYVKGNANISATGNLNLAAGQTLTLSGQAINLVAGTVSVNGTQSVTVGTASLTLGSSGQATLAGSSTTISASGTTSVNGSTVALGEGGSAGSGANGKAVSVPSLTVAPFTLPYGNSASSANT